MPSVSRSANPPRHEAHQQQHKRVPRKSPTKSSRPARIKHQAPHVKRQIARISTNTIDPFAQPTPDTFGPHVRDDPDTGRATVDWTDPAAMRELTRVMLRHDFGLLEWDAPLDRLCPPVANRLNYICWLSDLMKLSSSSSSSSSTSVSSPPSSSQQRRSSPEDAPASSGGGQGQEGDGGDGEPAEMTTAQRNLLLFGNAAGAGEEDEAMSVCDDDADGDSRTEAADGRPPGLPRRRGVDVGTGASCIYPLLGAKVAGWSFLATEIDAVSAEWAEKNVRSNGLQV